MKKLFFFFFFVAVFLTGILSHAQLVSHEHLKSVSKENVKSIPGIPRSYDIDLYKIIYKTDDLKGKKVNASGLVAIPKDIDCDTPPMVLYGHGTVLKKFNVPSRLKEGSDVPQAFASSGFIALAPDYLGLGDSPGLHPYLHAESEATASIDMIRASRELLKKLEVSFGNETFITGYSEGGHAGMAILKYAQDHNLIDELGIKAGGLISGSYNITGLQLSPLVFLNMKYPYLGYGVYFILGYQEAYGDLYEDISEIAQPQHIENIKKWYDGKQNAHHIADVNKALPDDINKIMKADYLKKVKADTNHPIWKAVEKNNLHDWKPEIPLRLYYCGNDKQVHPMNSTGTASAMKGKKAKDVEAVNISPTLSHTKCTNPSLREVYKFFRGLTLACKTGR